MAVPELLIYARVIEQDTLTGTDQARTLFPNETEKGILNMDTVSVQTFNSILRSITQHSRCNPFAPELLLSTASVPSCALEWVDGGTIVQADSPELFAHYGSTFPTLQATAPAGWKYIVRNQ